MRLTLLLSFCFTFLCAHAQNDRLKDENTIIWAQTFFTIPVSKKWDVIAEYQWRRTDGFKNWQQSLLRNTVVYKANQQLSFGAGYAWVETFSYGDFPVAANGTFPEHRLHEQVQLKNTFGKLLVNQRLRIEQRFVGSRAATAQREIEKWIFSNRFRYMLRLQHPITSSGKLFAAAADEVFISAGKTVGANILDQNRLMFILGAKLTPKINLEAGYISQTLLQGRRINNRTIVQNNEGLMMGLHFHF